MERDNNVTPSSSPSKYPQSMGSSSELRFTQRLRQLENDNAMWKRKFEQLYDWKQQIDEWIYQQFEFRFVENSDSMDDNLKSEVKDEDDNRREVPTTSSTIANNFADIADTLVVNNKPSSKTNSAATKTQKRPNGDILRATAGSSEKSKYLLSASSKDDSESSSSSTLDLIPQKKRKPAQIDGETPKIPKKHKTGLIPMDNINGEPVKVDVHPNKTKTTPAHSTSSSKTMDPHKGAQERKLDAHKKQTSKSSSELVTTSQKAHAPASTSSTSSTASKSKPSSSNRPSANGIPRSIDEEARCSVCDDKYAEENNEMMFCDSCNICVHQACYGVKEIPDADWFCKPCVAGLTEKPKCLFCPNAGGAMVPVRTPANKSWCHVFCALWLPEVAFLNHELMDMVIHVNKIPPRRWKLNCSLCKTKGGASIQCAYKKCVTAFHVTCASKYHLKMDGILDDDLNDGVALQAYCDKHRHKAAN